MTLARLWSQPALLNVTGDLKARVAATLPPGFLGSAGFLVYGGGALGTVGGPDNDKFVAEVGAIAPPMSAGAIAAATGMLVLVARLGYETAWAEAKTEATRDPGLADDTVKTKACQDAYALLADGYMFRVRPQEQVTVEYYHLVWKVHTTGIMDQKAFSLESVRLTGTIDQEVTSTMGTFSITQGKSVNHSIKTLAQFFGLAQAWGIAQVAAGSCRVGGAGMDPTAGTMGPEGNLPDGSRVFATLGCITMYMGFMYTMMERGVSVLLAVHAEVIRRVVELLLLKYNFASALINVIHSVTPTQMLMHLGYGSTSAVPSLGVSSKPSEAELATPTGRGGAEEGDGSGKELARIKKELIHSTKMLEDQKRKNVDLQRRNSSFNSNSYRSPGPYREGNRRASGGGGRKSRSRSRDRDARA